MGCNVRILDENLISYGMLAEFVSLVWIEKFNEEGDVQLVVNKTADMLSLLKIGRFLSIKESKTLAYIHGIEDNGDELWIYAKEAKWLLSNRVYTGTIDAQAANVETTLIDAVSTSRLPSIINCAAASGLTGTADAQFKYPSLSELCQTMCIAADYGYTLKYDKSNAKLIFTIYEGNEINNIKFAERYGNLSDLHRILSEVSYKNIAYVGGEEREGVARVYVTCGDDTLSDLDRREMFVDASSVTQDDMTDEQYRAALIAKGNEELALKSKVDSVEFSVIADIEEYGVDYTLGDWLTCVLPEYELVMRARITGVRLTWENNTKTLELTMGTPIRKVIK